MEILLMISLIANFVFVMAIKTEKKPDIVIKDVPFNASDKSDDIMEIRLLDEDAAKLFNGNCKYDVKQHEGGIDVKLIFSA